jgi:hypothetical protein
MSGTAAQPATVTVAFTDSAVDAVDGTTFTFSSKSLGTAAANRKIVVGVGERGSTSIASVSVAGVGATQLINLVSGTSNRSNIWIADVPTGTTGDVVVTCGTSALRCGIGVWAMYGAASSTPSDTASSVDDAGVDTLVVPANGVGIGYCFSVGTGLTATWSNMTERFDATVESGIFHTGADTAVSGSLSVGVDWTGTFTSAGMVAAAWAP